MLKRIIRAMLQIRNNESFEDGINRHMAHIKRTFRHERLSLNDIETLLTAAGITKGDTIIVHCSWRNCYMIDGTPDDVIDVLCNVIGDKGNLLMPCYPVNPTVFHVEEDPSAAGVLSELMRKRPDSIRGVFPKGTLCGIGPDAKDIVLGTNDTIYQFDENSPYARAIKQYDAKVVLIGLGVNPHKITAFHCGSYESRLVNEKLRKTYTKERISKICYNNNEKTIHFVDRVDGCSNNKKAFKSLFRSVDKKIIATNGLDVIVFKGLDAANVAYNYCANGDTLYLYK